MNEAWCTFLALFTATQQSEICICSLLPNSKACRLQLKVSRLLEKNFEGDLKVILKIKRNLKCSLRQGNQQILLHYPKNSRWTSIIISHISSLSGPSFTRWKFLLITTLKKKLVRTLSNICEGCTDQPECKGWISPLAVGIPILRHYCV